MNDKRGRFWSSFQYQNTNFGPVKFGNWLYVLQEKYLNKHTWNMLQIELIKK